MSKSEIELITVASWEDRFAEGTARILADHSIRSAHVFCVDKFSAWSLESRKRVADATDERGVIYDEVELPSDSPVQAWTDAIVPTVNKIANNACVLVDVSTMPREVIWQVFWLLSRKNCSVRYVYHRPGGYGDWLSRDPGKPRLAYKMSGLSKLNDRTALVVLAGYDVDRVQHLVATYEPSITLLGLQKDSVDPQNADRMTQQRKAFEKDPTVHVFEIDAYSADHGEKSIREAIMANTNEQNLILTSMGPKLSAIALFKMHWGDESLGLVYLPANEFNKDYSHGIGDSVYGELSSSIGKE
jgi:hypothetical protein